MTAPTDLPENPNHPGTWAALTPDKPAVIMASNGESMTYAELEDKANRLSHSFMRRASDRAITCLLHGAASTICDPLGRPLRRPLLHAIGSRLTTEELGYILENGGRQHPRVPEAEDMAASATVSEKIETKLVVGELEVRGLRGGDREVRADPAARRMEAQPMLLLRNDGTSKG